MIDIDWLLEQNDCQWISIVNDPFRSHSTMFFSQNKWSVVELLKVHLGKTTELIRHWIRAKHHSGIPKKTEISKIRFRQYTARYYLKDRLSNTDSLDRPFSKPAVTNEDVWIWEINGVLQLHPRGFNDKWRSTRVYSNPLIKWIPRSRPLFEPVLQTIWLSTHLSWYSGMFHHGLLLLPMYSQQTELCYLFQEMCAERRGGWRWDDESSPLHSLAVSLPRIHNFKTQKIHSF